MNTAAAVLGIALSSSAAMAGILSDGTFDILGVGNAPDIGTAAGAWQFPTNYVNNNLGEALATNYSIVNTASFDAAASGRSLHLNTGGEGAAMHLVNILTGPASQTANQIVTVGFDIWVVENGSLSSGGTIYLGGDHGGGGFSSTTDRGPQITWDENGIINAKNSSGQDITLTTGYQTNRWQSVRLEIDLTTDRFDAFWGPKGGPLAQIANDMVFRSASLDHIDRFTWARFVDQTKFTNAYLDNAYVNVPAPGALVLAGAAVLVGTRRRR